MIGIRSDNFIYRILIFSNFPRQTNKL